jgi:ribosomal protein RSM22 (predicted rRNA methylase)
MRLPEPLRAAIDEEVSRVDTKALSAAVARLSERYRSGKTSGALSEAVDRAAYLVTRVPATYAADAYVFAELNRRIATPVASMLDLGSGPGTAMWAAAEAIPAVSSFTAVERDAALIEVAGRIAARNPRLQNVAWRHADLRMPSPFQPHDILVLSYALNELPDPLATVRAAFAAARVALAIVEPGTPAAFANVLSARDLLISLGAHIAAPCPHHNACPLAIRNDWCHFAVRLERSAEHRRLKGGELGYEDEKFSYLIATKAPVVQPEARIVRHPLKHSGHVKLTLCTPNDLQHPTIGKSKKFRYRAARKAQWGDPWPLDGAEGSDN